MPEGTATCGTTGSEFTKAWLFDKGGPAMLPGLWRGEGGGFATRPLEEFRRQMGDLFSRFFGRSLVPFAGGYEEVRAWDFDVDDKGNEIVVKAEVPGFEANEIDVQLNNGVLTIQAEKKQKKDEAESYRSYRRTVTLPCGVQEDKATATCRNGVLELHLPKTEATKAKPIPIQAK
jgi:HSP20 family protein